MSVKIPNGFILYFSKTQVKSVPHLVSDGESTSSDFHDKVDMFNKYFQSVFVNEDDVPELPDMSSTIPIKLNLSILHFTTNVVFKVISAIKAGKACGPDNLSSRILKECATELTPSLTCILTEV